jgi:hypothetical protein
MKESIVQIGENLYRYGYDPQTKETRYLGPVGKSAPLTEEQFEDILFDLGFRGSGKPFGFATTRKQFDERKRILDAMEREFRTKTINFEDLGVSERVILDGIYEEWQAKIEKGSITPPMRNESLEIYRLQELGLVEAYPYVNITLAKSVPIESLPGAVDKAMAESKEREYEPEPGRVAVLFTRKGREMMERHQKPYVKKLEEWEI